MDNIKIKLITEDIDYGRMLCDGIAHMHRDIIMELETEEGTCNDKRDADLIVIDEPMLRKIVYDDSMMILCEKKSDRTIDTEAGVYRIWKYANLRKTLSDIIYVYGVKTGRSFAQPKNPHMHVLAFCSSVGGSGCTSIAVAVGQELIRTHKKNVLYLTLSYTGSGEEYMRPLSEGRDISEFLYHTLGRGRKISGMDAGYIESFIGRNENGLENFTPHTGKNPLAELDGVSMENFFDCIAESGRYEAVIADVGTSLSESAAACFRVCKSACFVRVPYRNKRRMQTQKDVIEKFLFEGKGRLIEVVNSPSELEYERRKVALDELFSCVEDSFTTQSAGIDIEQYVNESDFLIKYEPSSFTMDNGFKKIATDRAFAIEVKKITEKMIRPGER